MKIVLYTTHCPMCMLVERKLKQKNIHYEEVTDVDKIMELGFSHVPILQVDDKFFTDTQAIVKEIERL